MRGWETGTVRSSLHQPELTRHDKPHHCLPADLAVSLVELSISSVNFSFFFFFSEEEKLYFVPALPTVLLLSGNGDLKILQKISLIHQFGRCS